MKYRVRTSSGVLMVALLAGGLGIVVWTGGCGDQQSGKGTTLQQSGFFMPLDISGFYTGTLWVYPDSKTDFKAFAGKQIIDQLPFNMVR
jgi:hypothetical protein